MLEDIRIEDPTEYHFEEEHNPDGMGNSVVLRIARRPLHEQTMGRLKEACGRSIRVISARDVLFSKHPSDDVLAVIDALEEQGFDVIAVDLVAPHDVKVAVVNTPAIQEKHIPILAQELARDWDNAPLVVGQEQHTRRDVLQVLRYIELKPPIESND